jgi:hypothetical protein
VLTHQEIKVEADACFGTKIGHCLILRRIKNKRLLALELNKSALKNNKSTLIKRFEK